MKRGRFLAVAILCSAFSAGVALASWYDDYEAGLTALRAGQWKTVVQKMTAAIAGNPKESNNARTYGAIFINYHPYYYRAIGYMNIGDYEKAVADLEKTSGPGAVDRGSIDELMRQAKAKLAETVTPPVIEVQKPPVTQPPVTNTQPVAPAVDNALRNRARATLDQAKSHLQSAQQRKATGSQQYQNALSAYTAANSRLAAARSNDDLHAVIADAENITLLADSAQPPNVAVVMPPPPPSKTLAAGSLVLGETNRRLRRALQDYFDGDFDEAARGFQSLTRDMPTNGWIWAFLGASQYSQYAFEGEDNYKTSAIEAFRKAKAYGKWKDGLPEKYFSKRIRKAFRENAG